jgi:ankyrin repeat protein
MSVKTLYRVILTVTVLSVIGLAPADDNLELLEAAEKGNLEIVQSLLLNSADVNTATQDGTTALHWAALHDDIELAALLLEAGADPDPANEYGVTPLWLACTNRNGDMAERLLQAGADPNAALWTGETVLMNCARTGAADAVSALLSFEADVGLKESKKHQTALMWAAAGGHADVVQLLVDHGADIKTPSRGGFTPLLFAARSGDVDTARILVEAGADPDEATPEHGNSLIIASESGHEELALFLLEQGANPNVTDQHGITPLHFAVGGGLSLLDAVVYDPVFRVAPSNMLKLAKALLEAGADPNAQIARNRLLGPENYPFSMVGATPLLLAAASADAPLMLLLEEFEADPKLNTREGVTPLIAAAWYTCSGTCAFKGGGNVADKTKIELSLQAVKLAIRMGVEVNAVNKEGRTAMHMAAFTGADPVVQYLADHGAEVNVRDKNGETPWSMASGLAPRFSGNYGVHESTAALLLKLGASPVTDFIVAPVLVR